VRHQQPIQEDGGDFLVVGDVEPDVELRVGKPQEREPGDVKVLVPKEEDRAEDVAYFVNGAHLVL
jgi:hypothetical protein